MEMVYLLLLELARFRRRRSRRAHLRCRQDMEHVRINVGSLRDDAELTTLPDLWEFGRLVRRDVRRSRGWVGGETYHAIVVNPSETVAYAVGADTVDGDVLFAPRHPATMHHADIGHHLRPRCCKRPRMLRFDKREVGINRRACTMFGHPVANRKVSSAREKVVMVGVDEVFEGNLAKGV